MGGYVRVSRVGDRSGVSYISPEVQRRAIEAWGRSNGARIRLYEPEENVSGGKMDRPVFNRVMQDIRAGVLGGMVVWKYDRFSRTMVGGLTTVEELTALGAIFASATEPQFDQTTAVGRMMFGQNLLMAAYFRENATEVWKTSLTFAVERGVHIAPSIPYGYDKDDSSLLHLNEAAPFVAKAYEYRVAGRSYQWIAQWLTTNAPARLVNVRGAYVERAWTDAVVARVLSRRVYMGHAHWGDQVNENAHPAIVLPEIWQRAQEKVSAISRRCTTEDVALLHAVARCAGCGFGLSRALHSSTGGPQYKRRYYRCRRTHVSGICGAPAMIRADGDDGLETYVEDLFCAELDARHLAHESVEDSSALSEALAAQEGAQADFDAFRADTRARRRLGERWSQFLDAYITALEEAQAQVAELRVQAPMTTLTSTAYRSLPREQRAVILRDSIDAIMVRQDTAHRGRFALPVGVERVLVLWKGQLSIELPARGKAGKLVIFEWPSDERAAGKAPTKR